MIDHGLCEKATEPSEERGRVRLMGRLKVLEAKKAPWALRRQQRSLRAAEFEKKETAGANDDTSSMSLSRGTALHARPHSAADFPSTGAPVIQGMDRIPNPTVRNFRCIKSEALRVMGMMVPAETAAARSSALPGSSPVSDMYRARCMPTIRGRIWLMPPAQQPGISTSSDDQNGAAVIRRSENVT